MDVFLEKFVFSFFVKFLLFFLQLLILFSLLFVHSYSLIPGSLEGMFKTLIWLVSVSVIYGLLLLVE